MDQPQSMDTKADGSSGGNFSGYSSSAEQRVSANGSHSRNQIQKKQQSLVGNYYMSEEELKIRGELENDIERDLEEEIKDGIYHLALRLHRLYQHQKERNARQAIESSGHYDHHSKKNKNKTLCEVNINIRMEGGTKIEIKETKKELEDPDKGRPWTSSRSENMQPHMQVVSNKKKFDWADSLRSGADPVANNKRKTGVLVSHPNSNIETGRRNLISAPGQRKGSSGVDNNKVLEQGWKW